MGLLMRPAFDAKGVAFEWGGSLAEYCNWWNDKDLNDFEVMLYVKKNLKFKLIFKTLGIQMS